MIFRNEKKDKNMRFKNWNSWDFKTIDLKHCTLEMSKLNLWFFSLLLFLSQTILVCNFIKIFPLCYREMTHSVFFRIAKDLSICLKSTLWNCLTAIKNHFHPQTENICEETRHITTEYISVA